MNSKNLELPRDVHAFLLKKSISSDFDIATGFHFDARRWIIKL